MRLITCLLLLLEHAAHAQFMPGMGGQEEDDGPRGDSMKSSEVLTDETFEERRMDSSLLLVYYRPGSNHQALEHDKEVELAAGELARTEDDALTIGIIDTDTHKAAAMAAKINTKQEVRPQLQFFRRGKHMADLRPYGGDARSIVNFMRTMAAPVSEKLDTVEAVNTWIKGVTMTSVLGIFSDPSRPSHNEWVRSAEGLRPPFRFAECSTEVAKAAKLFAKGAAALEDSKNQYAVVRPSKWLGKGEEAYKLSSDFAGMAKVVKGFAETKVAPLNQYVRRRIREQGRASVVLGFDLDKLDKMFKYLLNRLSKAIDAEPELTSRFHFTMAHSKHLGRQSADFGIDLSKDFSVTVVNTSSVSFWGFDGLHNISIESFSALPLLPFLAKIANGEEPPYIRSEEPPTTPPAAGQVGKAVGKTFGEIVDNESLDVVLVLHASKPPSQELVEAAELLTSLPTVRFVGYNVTANYLNTSRMEVSLGSAEEQQIFFASASKKGKEAYREYTKKVDSISLAEYVLKSKEGGTPAHFQESAKGAIAKRKKQIEKERREMNPGLAEIMKQQQQQAGGDGAEDAEGGGGKKKKKKKKKTKGKKASGENKAEL